MNQLNKHEIGEISETLFGTAKQLQEYLGTTHIANWRLQKCYDLRTCKSHNKHEELSRDYLSG